MAAPRSGGVQWLEDDRVADWIELGDSTRGYPEVVRDLVPDHFQAYARLVHPFRLNGRLLRWEALASEGGRTLTPTTRVEDLLVTTLKEARDAGLAVGGGMMSPEVWDALGPILKRHTTSDTVVFGIWEGRGTPPGAPPVAPFSLPNRRYFLAEVPFTDAATSEVIQHMVHIAWPADRSWFLNTDIDCCSTYVGGQSELVAELLDSSELEAMPAELDHPVFMY